MAREMIMTMAVMMRTMRNRLGMTTLMIMMMPATRMQVEMAKVGEHY